MRETMSHLYADGKDPMERGKLIMQRGERRIVGTAQVGRQDHFLCCAQEIALRVIPCLLCGQMLERR